MKRASGRTREHCRGRRGQAVTLFALLIPLTVLFFLGVVDYMVTNARVMKTVAAADLAAHAGAQQIQVRPNGLIETQAARGRAVAAAYFTAQAPPEATLLGTSCGQSDTRPACQVHAEVQSAGWLLPAQWIRVTAVGYLVAGVTAGDQ